MTPGIKGNTPSTAQELSYNSEQKLLREQVLAALRKLDAGEISVVEFLDIIFAMGIELPEGVLKQLKLQQQSGLLDWRACVHELDGYVFKHRSLEDDAPHEMTALAKRKLITTLRGNVSRHHCLDVPTIVTCGGRRALWIRSRSCCSFFIAWMRMEISC